ncbi:hypothetical protein VitviT2T_017748 [Vitis vinifera]|uniref:TAF6 C-terminal HEAT repeat domain-containing protein n=1 Tax=Vitis vinifera TaxID=29760 RepID=A0ABY9CXC3_VITVI|nr:hypothetical protein VitviT2T_017748 [Vitis vinifera]
MITVVYLSLLHDNMNSIPIIKVAPRWQEKHRRQVPKANTVSPSQTTSPINAAAQLQLKLLASNYPLWRARFVTFLCGYDGSHRDSSAMINKESEILSNLEHKIWKQYDRLFLHTVTCLCFEVRLMKLGLVLVDFMPTSQVDIFEKFNFIRFCRFGHVYNNQQTQLTETLLHAFLDPKRSMTQHYGAIQGLAALGPNMVRLLVVPNLEPYLRLLEPEMLLEKQKNEIKRHEAWRVYGALLVRFVSNGFVMLSNIIPKALSHEIFERSVYQQSINLAFYAQRNNSTRLKNTKSGKPKHSIASASKSSPSSLVSCQICDKEGHMAKRCWTFLNLKKKQFANLAEAFTACSIPDSNDSAWYPDSGATSHLTNDPEGVDVPTVYSGNEQVMVGNGLGHKSSVGGQQM